MGRGMCQGLLSEPGGQRASWSPGDVPGGHRRVAGASVLPGPPPAVQRPGLLPSVSVLWAYQGRGWEGSDRDRLGTGQKCPILGCSTCSDAQKC